MSELASESMNTGEGGRGDNSSTVTVFPIGHYMGERHPEQHHVVRVGLAHQTLTPDEFGVWVLSHGTDEIGRDAWTLGAVFDLAESAGITGAPELVPTMVAAGLLDTVAKGPRGPADARRFAETHRMHPMLIGLGNTDAEPDRYQVGFPGQPPVAVLDEAQYELWQWGQLAPSLWHTCEVREKVAAGLGEPAVAADLVGDLLGDLRGLLANSCAYLDLARQG